MSCLEIIGSFILAILSRPHLSRSHKKRYIRTTPGQELLAGVMPRACPFCRDVPVCWHYPQQVIRREREKVISYSTQVYSQGYKQKKNPEKLQNLGQNNGIG